MHTPAITDQQNNYFCGVDNWRIYFCIWYQLTPLFLNLVTADALLLVFGDSWRTYSCIWRQLAHLFLHLVAADAFIHAFGDSWRIFGCDHVNENWRNDSCMLHEVTQWLKADAELLLHVDSQNTDTRLLTSDAVTRLLTYVLTKLLQQICKYLRN